MSPPPPRWDGRVVAVTGASSGVGRAVSERLVADGADVCLLARDRERVEATASELGPSALALPTDVADPGQVQVAFATIGERFGRLDALLNVAGAARARRIEDATDQDIAAVVGTNLLGPIHTTRSAVPLLRASGAADIVNISSEITLGDLPMMSLYSSTKRALESFTRSMTTELRADGIRVTLAVLGRTGGTDFGANFSPADRAAMRAAWDADGYTARVGDSEPLTAEEVADVLVFAITRPRTMMLDVLHVRASGLDA